MVCRTLIVALAVAALAACAGKPMQPAVCAAAHPTAGRGHTGPEVARVRVNRAATVRVNPGGDAHGTGIVINDEGYILTAYHVVRGATAVKVEIPRASRIRDVVPALVVATHESADLALLKIHVPVTGTVVLGDLPGVYAGDGIYTDSYAYTYGPVLTRGYLTSKRHTLSVDGQDFGVVALGHLPEAPGSSGCGAFSVRDGSLLGMLIMSLEVSRDTGERVFQTEVFVPVRRIRMFLDAHHIEYATAADEAADPS